MNRRDMNLRDVVSKDRLRRPPLRVQLTVLYAGLFLALVAAVLGVSGLLIRHSVGVAPGAQPSSVGTHNVATSHSFEVWPAIVGLVAVLVAAWLAWWIAGRFLRPLQAMNTAAQEISATNLHRRLGLNGPNDELTELGRTLDELFGRLEASFDSQRHFVANASHELRTPLAGQRTLLQVALADPDTSAESLRAVCEEALALGHQQERLIEALLTLASSERGIETRESFDLADLTGQVILSRQEEAQRRGVDIRASLVSAPTSGDTDLMESLIANLLDNAIHHNVPAGTVDVATRRADGASQISVSNSGPVIPAADIDRLFHPFQRLGHERTQTSSGLGLAIVKAIADAHGAVLTATTRSQGGLDVLVILP